MFPANRDAFLDTPSTRTASLRNSPNSYASSIPSLQSSFSYEVSPFSGISTVNSGLFGSASGSIFDDTFSQNEHSVRFLVVLDPALFETHSQSAARSSTSLSSTDLSAFAHSENFAIDSGAERAISARKKIASFSEPTRLLEPTPFQPALPTSNRRDQLSGGLSSWVLGAASRLEKVERETIRHQVLQCFDSYQPDDELIINAKHVTELPECIGIVWHIKRLDLSGCRSLKSLPNVLHNFMRLDVLNLTNCSNLKALPPTVTALNGFAVLYLSGSGVSLSNPINSRLLTF